MNREFYKRVKEELDNNKNIYIATIVKDKKDKHLGKKILKVDNEIIIEEQENMEFYKAVIDKFNFNEFGKIV